MNMWRRILLALFALVLCLPVADAEPEAKADDLRKLAESLTRAARDGRQEPFQELAIPNPEQWFVKIFREEVGQGLAGIYASYADRIPPLLLQKFAQIANRRGLKFDSKGLDETEGTTGYPAALPIARVAAAPHEVYGLWFTSKDEPVESLGYWAFVDGAFRFAGWMYVARPENTPQLLLVGPGANLQDVRPTKKKNPVPRYPALARQAWIQGTVLVQAGVAPDGSLRQIEAISGHPLLVQSVLEAVQGWRYVPLLIDGQPVEAILIIEVKFTLSQ